MKAKKLCMILFMSLALTACSGKKDVTTTENVDVEISPEEAMNIDISYAKTLYTAICTSLANEDVYTEITENYAGQLIVFSEEGLKVLSESTQKDIVTNNGTIDTEVKYVEKGADHFAFCVDKTGNVAVYVCNEDNTKRWELAPDLDVAYGGEDTTETTEEVEEEPENAADLDVTTAKVLYTAVQTTLGSEDGYTDLVEGNLNQLIAYTEDGLNKLSVNTRDLLTSNFGNSNAEIMHRSIGADHFAFSVDGNSNVTVYACNADNTKIWELAPEADADYFNNLTGTDIGVTQSNNEITYKMPMPNTTYHDAVGEIFLLVDFTFYSEDEFGIQLTAMSIEGQYYSAYSRGLVAMEKGDEPDTWVSVDGNIKIKMNDSDSFELYDYKDVDVPFTGSYTTGDIDFDI